MGRAVLLLLGVGLLAAGCGGDGEGTTAPAAPEPREAPAATEPSTTRTTPPPRVAPSPKPAPRCTVGDDGLGRRRRRRRSPRSLDHRASRARRPGDRELRPAQRQRGADDLPRARRTPRPRLPVRRGTASSFPSARTATDGWIRASAARRYVRRLPHRRRPLRPGRDRVQGRARSTCARATAIGRSETPTPTGSFYVNQRLLSADPSGPFGPGGIGISAFSPVADRLGAGRPDRDPRDEPARVDRHRGLERVPADRERRPRAADPRDPGRDTRRIRA